MEHDEDAEPNWLLGGLAVDADLMRLPEKRPPVRDWKASSLIKKSKQPGRILEMLEHGIEKLSKVRWLPAAPESRRIQLLKIHKGASCPLPGPFVALLKARGIDDDEVLKDAAEIARRNRGTMESALPVRKSRLAIPLSYAWNYAVCVDSPTPTPTTPILSDAL